MTQKNANDTTPAPPTGTSPRVASLLGEHDYYLFGEGTHNRLYRKLGAHPDGDGEQGGVFFSVWAPNAQQVSVMGSFNGWDGSRHPLSPCGDSGIWETFVPAAHKGDLYKFRILARSGAVLEKSDPFAIFTEIAPRTASIVWDLDYAWQDGEWMANRHDRNSGGAPYSIYECHLGSWMRNAADGYRSLSYRELAPRLVEHLRQTGFTHVEFLPIMEHPFFGSWGYQTTGYFAPSSRFGTPQDLMYLIDCLHQNGIGVILDWVPSHFPNDPHGLAEFDGTHLYEHSDPRQGYHPDWSTYVYNYGRHEVRSFLLSSALFWLEHYHVDGIRVDAVASMLYLDYSRKEGEWVPNRYGGRENLEAISFLRRLNQDVYGEYPDVQTMAEESTAWPMVSRPTYLGGLGFGMKWDMGWMHDTLAYMEHDPVHRKFHHSQLTFRQIYAFTENFVLALSHDEVVYGKHSLLNKMPGDEWQQYANLRLLYGYMFGQSGKKLLFMGGEFGQRAEWNHDGELEWGMLQYQPHQGIQKWVSDLNGFYRGEPVLYRHDFDPEGFEWIDCNDAEQSTLSFIRRSPHSNTVVLVVCNFTPVVRQAFRVGVPRGGWWQEVLNSDAHEYGGSGQGNAGGVNALAEPQHGRPFSLSIALPPLATVFFRSTGE